MDDLDTSDYDFPGGTNDMSSSSTPGVRGVIRRPVTVKSMYFN